MPSEKPEAVPPHDREKDSRSAASPPTSAFRTGLRREIDELDASIRRADRLFAVAQFAFGLLVALAIDGLIYTIPTGHPGSLLTNPVAGLAGLIGVLSTLSLRDAPALAEEEREPLDREELSLAISTEILRILSETTALSSPAAPRKPCPAARPDLPSCD